MVTFIGHLIVGSAKYNTSTGASQITAGLAIIGFGGACCQMAAFSLPELLPNKWRHIGVVFADLVVYVTVIVAPVTARFGYQYGNWEVSIAIVAIKSCADGLCSGTSGLLPFSNSYHSLVFYCSTSHQLTRKLHHGFRLCELTETSVPANLSTT